MSSHRAFVQRLHAAPPRGVFAITGGAAGLLAELLTVPGASNTVLDAQIPYHPSALQQWLGSAPEQACSAETATAMAMAAYQRALILNDAPRAPSFGFGITASLATTRIKRGAHRVHLALQTAAATSRWQLELARDSRDRAQEEALICALALRCLGEGLGLAGASPGAELPDLALHERETVAASRIEAPKPWQTVLAGEQSAVQVSGTPMQPKILFPGAFDPLHSGHLGMAECATQLTGQSVAFEISLNNVDKPPLDFLTLEHRAAQFPDTQALWFSSQPTFLDKARTFPGVRFLVGIDTLVRIADPRYYGDDAARRNQALHELTDLGCSFLVFGRSDAHGFKSLSNHDLPASLTRLCEAVAEADFRDDASSSAIRAHANLPRAID